MKIINRALRKLIQEAVEDDRIIRERSWSVEFAFKLSGGTASDSEGKGPDGFEVVMSGESGKTIKVVVDSYWNPQAGDQSGNSIKITGDVEEESCYVPQRFDDGKEQVLVISNEPVRGMVTVSHGIADELPVVYAVFQNPFGDDEDVDFSTETIGNGSADVKLKRHTNL
jgi:hypothetical protein